MCGLCVGHNLAKGWEIDAEVHLDSSERMQRSEAIVNLGTRYDFSQHATLLAAVGRDTSNSLAARISLLTYLGVQIRL
jgi:hypothetical protein